MLNNRGMSGCGRTTINDKPLLVVFGGYDVYIKAIDRIQLYGFASKTWSAAPSTTMKMLEVADGIMATNIRRMDNDGCEMMFINYANLYICKDNYQWTKFPVTGMTDSGNPVVTVGANDFLPCGVY
jgi:hypothetical protein